MRRHNFTLSEPLSQMVQAQVRSGRYMDFSAALQDAAWNFFYGTADPFTEYCVSPEQVERAGRREAVGIARDRKAGKLKAWKPRA